MRDNFNKQLEDLYSSVKYMGSLCEKAIENASQTVVGDNADKIKEYAKNVNFYEKKLTIVKTISKSYVWNFYFISNL